MRHCERFCRKGKGPSVEVTKEEHKKPRSINRARARVGPAS